MAVKLAGLVLCLAMPLRDFQQTYQHKLNSSLVSVHLFSVAFMLCHIVIFCCAAPGGQSEGINEVGRQFGCCLNVQQLWHSSQLWS